MKTLAIDTSTAVATVAVVEDGNLMGVTTLNLNKPHSQKIMPLIENILKELELTPADIDLFAAAKGPGSFTGLRIGIAAVKGFSLALNKPSVGVSTLKALVYQFTTDNYICPIIDARRNQVYNGLYKLNNTISPPNVADISELLPNLPVNEKIIFTGDGVAKHKNLIIETLGENAVIPVQPFCVNSAVTVALLAEEMFRNGETEENLLPEYLIKHI